VAILTQGKWAQKSKAQGAPKIGSATNMAAVASSKLDKISIWYIKENAQVYSRAVFKVTGNQALRRLALFQIV
jgi:hypothetical protein